jgi:hypothetical protein
VSSPRTAWPKKQAFSVQWLVSEFLPATPRFRVRERKASHRGHGGHRGGSEGGDLCRGHWWLGGGIRRRGRHRTEVTEDTEGDRKGETAILGHRWLGCGIRRRGRHRTEVTEGELRLVGELVLATPLGWGARNTLNGKASHRGHRGHRGGSGLVGRNFCRLLSAWVRESRKKRKASHEGHAENELKSNSVTDVLTHKCYRCSDFAAWLCTPNARTLERRTPNAERRTLERSNARTLERSNARTPNPELSFDAHGFIAIAFPPLYLVRWLSGRKRRFAKALYPKRVPRVRIPASPYLAHSKPLTMHKAWPQESGGNRAW